MKSLTVFNLISIIVYSVVFSGCTSEKPNHAQQVKDEILNAEHQFAEMTKTKSIAEAFAYFADSNAVIKRQNDTLIFGKPGIRNFYDKPQYKTAEVGWNPDFIRVSDDGTMAYTYGKYLWKFKMPDGKSAEYRGVFHTVWKRQSDGSWKYVWD